MRLCVYLLFAAVLSAPLAASAVCQSTALVQAGQGALSIGFGHVQLAGAALQPPASLLAGSLVTAADYHQAAADSVLWHCDKADWQRGEVYFLAATNGANRLSGHHPAGVADGLADVYATWFAHIGLHLEMDGKSLNRRWQRIELQSWQDEGAQIAIRVQDLPSVQAQLYRVSDSLPTSGGAEQCPPLEPLSASATPYHCTAASAFLQLAGHGLVHDNEGEDSATQQAGTAQGIALRLTSLAVSRQPTCVVRSATQAVRLPAVSAAQMEQDAAPEAPFSVQLECEQTSQGAQALIGLQVSAGAFSAAQRLGLVNAQGGVSHLLSDNYDASGMARGVGIGLFDAAGARLSWVGQDTGTAGEASGWYPVLQHAKQSGRSGEIQQWQMDFSARLLRLSGEAVTPGKIRATAYVLVKLP